MTRFGRQGRGSGTGVRDVSTIGNICVICNWPKISNDVSMVDVVLCGSGMASDVLCDRKRPMAVTWQVMLHCVPALSQVMSCVIG